MVSFDFDPGKLKFIRKKLDLTQSAFAKEANVSQSLIAKVEAGRIDPTFSKVKQIADAVDRLSHREEKKAGDVMTKEVVSAKPKDIVADLVGVMTKKSISQIPVLDGHRIVGMVSEAGILESNISKPLTEMKARDIMAGSPPTVSPSAPISMVMGMLRFSPAVLVVDGGSVHGIITKSDLLRTVLK